jgi:hypothetical protein
MYSMLLLYLYTDAYMTGEDIIDLELAGSENPELVAGNFGAKIALTANGAVLVVSAPVSNTWKNERLKL